MRTQRARARICDLVIQRALLKGTSQEFLIGLRKKAPGDQADSSSSQGTLTRHAHGNGGPMMREILARPFIDECVGARPTN